MAEDTGENPTKDDTPEYLKDLQLPPEIKAYIKSLTGKDQKKAIEVWTIAQKKWKGPLPPPEQLAEYDKVVHKGAERIFKSFEEQFQHRINLENTVVPQEQRQSARGQLFAFFICIFFGGIALTLGLLGKEIAASVIGGGDLVALATVFIAGRPRSN